MKQIDERDLVLIDAGCIESFKPVFDESLPMAINPPHRPVGAGPAAETDGNDNETDGGTEDL